MILINNILKFLPKNYFLFLKFNGLQAYEPYTIAIYLSFMLLSLVAIGISALMIACAFYFYLELKKEEKQIQINS